jgi:hydroxybutyrate-dimer hydrolase
MHRRILPLVLLLAACSSSSTGGGAPPPDVNTLPSFVRGGAIHTTYDGSTNDLLTGGLGKTGLASATPPGFADPAHPTAAELRTRAIYTNYRALVDSTSSGGYGLLWGPNVDTSGNDTLGEGEVAGDEWLAYDDDGTGSVNVTMMVQVPASFDRANPCIVTGTSSGSRGVYGAIAAAGEWGLKHGCAVAYSDKGSGIGLHDLHTDTVNLIDGTRAGAEGAGTRSHFTAALTAAERAAFDAATPYRFAVKHAHSQLNPEKDWGTYTLHAVEFAYWVLNQTFGTAQSDGSRLRLFHPGQIVTIAASVSNGGGAALAAAEQDTQGYITGVVAGEPQVQVASTAVIKRGATTVAASARPLYDYDTAAQLFQPCAGLSSSASDTASLIALYGGANGAAGGTNRCAALHALGYLAATDAAGQADEALAKLHQAGWEADSDLLHGTMFYSYASPAVAVTYANTYARASVKDNLCGYSFATVDAIGVPTVASGAAVNSLAQYFALANGVPPSAPIQLVANGAANGPVQDQLAQSRTAQTAGISSIGSGGATIVADYNSDGASCLRSLYTGTDGKGAAIAGALSGQSTALRAGIQQVLRTGRLHGLPTILVQGRSDALVPVNHASRAYYGANQLAEPGGDVHYYEVEHAQHFDAFLPLAPLAGRFLPLHRYVVQALDLMYARLKRGTALPPSQVVRTTPRGYDPATTLPNPIAPSNVPPITAAPATSDRITFTSGTLTIPD